MTSHEFADANPSISYDFAYRITDRHLAAPGVELAAAIAQGDVIVIGRAPSSARLTETDRIDTRSLIVWLGY